MIDMNHTMSKTKIIKTQLINVIMLHALNYFIKCVKHVAIINNSWQEPQALEIQIFCSGIIFRSYIFEALIQGFEVFSMLSEQGC